VFISDHQWLKPSRFYSRSFVFFVVMEIRVIREIRG